MAYSSNTYRSEIDGLRAIAVLAVIFYHLQLPFFGSGFVGVDIFFVISGYLISKTNLKNLRDGTWSFQEFYIRRIKRIFPALIVLLALVLILSFALITYGQFQVYWNHFFGSSTFSLNFILWKEVGYFDSETLSKPLMHLWSLAVEEQFYLFEPFLFWVLWWQNKKIFNYLLLLSLISFAFNIYLIGTDPSAAFYLPWARFWEIFLGSLLACQEFESFGQSRLLALLRWDQNSWAKSSIGALLILAALIFVKEGDSFPGWWALLPVLGTVFVISAKSGNCFNRKVLSWPPLVFIGKISYPLYLFHWSILSLLYLHEGNLDKEVVFIVLVSSLVLSWLTYEFVERPIRRASSSQVSNLKIAAGLCFALLFVSLLAPFVESRLRVVDNDGIRLSPDPTKSSCPLAQKEITGARWCESDNREAPTRLLLGDSHAGAFYHGLVNKSAPGERWMVIAREGCLPAPNLVTEGQSTCLDLSRSTLEQLKADQNIKLVLLVLSNRGIEGASYRFADKNKPLLSANDIYFEGVAETVRQILNAGRQAAIFVPTPEIAKDLGHCSTDFFFQKQDKVYHGCAKTLAKHKERTADYLDILRKLKALFPDLSIYDPANVLCRNAICSVRIDDRFAYAYTDHLSDFGAELVAEDFLAKFPPH